MAETLFGLSRFQTIFHFLSAKIMFLFTNVELILLRANGNPSHRTPIPTGIRGQCRRGSKKISKGGVRKNYRRRRLKPRSGVHEGGRGLYILVMVCDDESTCRLAGFFFDGRWIGVGRLETLSMVRRYRGRLPSVRLKFGTF